MIAASVLNPNVQIPMTNGFIGVKANGYCHVLTLGSRRISEGRSHMLVKGMSNF